MRLKTIGLIGALALGLLVAPLVAAPQSGKMARIGYLSHHPGPGDTDEAFRRALSDLGWIEGKNIALEYRWAAGNRDRYPDLAKELVRGKVDVLVTSTVLLTRAAKNATTTIPIVMRWAADAVENGLVASLARPGGNVTGLSEQYAVLNTKLLELLHETLPKAKRVAFLWSPDSPVYVRTFRAAQAVAPNLGLTLESIALRHKGRSMEKTRDELENMLEASAREQAAALVVMGRLYATFGPQIAAFASKHQVPVFSVSSTGLQKYFGLLGYTPDFRDMSRRAATYVDKVLKGAKPKDLPVQLPKKFTLVVNMKTAKKMGITIPPSILYRADKLIK